MLWEESQTRLPEGLARPHLLTSCPQCPSLRSPRETGLGSDADLAGPAVRTASPGQCDAVDAVDAALDWSRGGEVWQAL